MLASPAPIQQPTAIRWLPASLCNVRVASLVLLPVYQLPNPAGCCRGLCHRWELPLIGAPCIPSFGEYVVVVVDCHVL